MNPEQLAGKETPRKRLQACRCRYMAERNWGYDIQRYVGGRKYWKAVGCAPDIKTAEAVIASHEIVLVRCNGCGAELLREYPARADSQSAEGVKP